MKSGERHRRWFEEQTLLGVISYGGYGDEPDAVGWTALLDCRIRLIVFYVVGRGISAKMLNFVSIDQEFV